MAASADRSRWKVRLSAAALVSAVILQAFVARTLVLHAHHDEGAHLHQLVAVASNRAASDHQDHAHPHGHSHPHPSHAEEPAQPERQAPPVDEHDRLIHEDGVRVLLVLGADPLRTHSLGSSASRPLPVAETPPPALLSARAAPRMVAPMPMPEVPERPPPRSGVAAVLSLNHALLF